MNNIVFVHINKSHRLFRVIKTIGMTGTVWLNFDAANGYTAGHALLPVCIRKIEFQKGLLRIIRLGKIHVCDYSWTNLMFIRWCEKLHRNANPMKKKKSSISWVRKDYVVYATIRRHCPRYNIHHRIVSSSCSIRPAYDFNCS